MRDSGRARVRYESVGRKTRRRTEPEKPKGLSSGKFITVLLVIGAILYFISG